MPVHVFYQKSLPMLGEQFEAEEHAHIRVLRLRDGEEATFLNGAGAVVHARLCSSKEQVWAVVSRREMPEPPMQGLLLPLLKGSKLDWVVEKSVELGTTHLGLFPAERSQERQPKWERLHHLLVAAMKQSGAVYLPKIEFLPALSEWTAWPWGLQQVYFGSLLPDAQPISKLQVRSPWGWSSGPEGGWSDAEEVHLRELGATPVRLHGLILRAETAAICGLGCLSAFQEEAPHKPSRPE